MYTKLLILKAESECTGGLLTFLSGMRPYCSRITKGSDEGERAYVTKRFFYNKEWMIELKRREGT